MITSRPSSIVGSGTLSHRMSCLPCQVMAFIVASIVAPLFAPAIDYFPSPYLPAIFPRAETALAQSENEVTYDLRELFIQLEKRKQILESSERLVELAELKLSTEQEKYRSGLSTLAYVVQFQREFDSARIARQRAAFDVIVLRARIANTMGVLYREAGLEVR